MRVLIVEDSPDEAATFVDLVAHHGHAPIVAPTAEAALESLSVSCPDAVLLDVSLPGMSGIEFLRILSERRQPLPVVVISGLATEEQARRCLELGAVEFLLKPITLDQLAIVLGFIEVQLLTRRFTEDVMQVDQRKYPRAKVSLEVTVEDRTGGQWQGQSVNLSPFGLKLRSAANVPRGGTVRLLFNPPDRGVPITVLSLMIRRDPDGQAFAFINLSDPDFQRLKRFVDSRLRPPS